MTDVCGCVCVENVVLPAGVSGVPEVFSPNSPLFAPTSKMVFVARSWRLRVVGLHSGGEFGVLDSALVGCCDVSAAHDSVSELIAGALAHEPVVVTLVRSGSTFCVHGALDSQVVSRRVLVAPSADCVAHGVAVAVTV